jgi:guanylate kinase
MEKLSKGFKRIILCGHGASGKDHLRKRLEHRGFEYALSYTTRPPRENETSGQDYRFVSEDQAQAMIKNGEFYEWVRFNDWIYGTTQEQFYSKTLFIMTPRGLEHLLPEDRAESLIIFIDIPEEIRIGRLANRAMPGDTLERRVQADRLDFANFTNYDIRISNADF